MKHITKYLIPFILLLILAGCPGAIDSLVYKDIGHGYIYHEVVNLPTISNKLSDKSIPGVVVSYDYNDNFIIVLQKDCELPKEEEYNLIVKGKYYDLAIEEGNSKYWIIVHSYDSIYGPLKKEEFLQQRIELNIPEELVLKKE